MKASNILLLLVVFTLAACAGSEKEVDKIGDAQICLDSLGISPTSAEVSECLKKVEGITSVGAESIRCAGGFIREGFGSPKRFVDAMGAIDGGTSGSNMQTLMGLLTFTAEGAVNDDLSNAQTTFNSCLSSGGKGATLLASYTYLTMSMVRYYNSQNAGGCPSTPGTDSNGYKFYDLGSCIQNGILDTIHLVDASTGNTDAQTAQNGIGAVIISAHLLSCSGSGSKSPLCGVLDTAISEAGGTSNPRVVAVKFFEEIVNP